MGLIGTVRERAGAMLDRRALPRGAGPDPRRLMLHVGPHKTGTKAIQSVLVLSRRALARHSIAYPRAGCSRTAHFPLSRALTHGETDWLPRGLRSECAPFGTVVLSSEAFALLDEAKLAALRSALPDRTVEVAYALRRQTGLWPSYWRESVHGGSALTFDRFLEIGLSGHGWDEIGHDLRQLAQLRRLRAVFDPGAIVLTGFDAAVERDGTPVDAFARDVLRVPPGTLRASRQDRHGGLDDATTELLRRGNALHDARHGRRRDPARAMAVAARVLAEHCEEVERFAHAFARDARAVAFSSAHPTIRDERSRIEHEFGDEMAGDAEAAWAAYGREGEGRVRTSDREIEFSPGLRRLFETP